MSGGGIQVPIVPIAGRRTATHWSVNRQIKRIVLQDWLDAEVDVPSSFLGERIVGFGAESPDTISEEAERIEANGEDPGDYTPSRKKIQWSKTAEPGTFDVFVHLEGYAPTELAWHWLSTGLAWSMVEIDATLRRLGYRRRPYPFPSVRGAFFRGTTKPPFASPLFCVIDGAYWTIEGDVVRPYMNARGEQAGGAPKKIASLKNDDRARVEALRDANRCGCSYCTQARKYRYLDFGEAKNGWIVEGHDGYGWRETYVPLARKRRLLFAKMDGRTWVYRSLDDGITWRPPRVWPHRALLSAVRTARDGVETALVAVRHRDGTTRLRASTDQGRHWTETPFLFADAKEVFLFASDARREDVVAVTPGKLARAATSHDGGLTFRACAPLRVGKKALRFVRDVAFSPRDPRRFALVATAGEDRWATPRVLLRTDDDGASFSPVATPSARFAGNALLGAEAGTIVVTDHLEGKPHGSYVARSEDGARTWKTVKKLVGESDEGVYAQKNGRWIWSLEDACWVSEDEGRTWTQLPRLGFDVADADSDDVWYGTGEVGLFRMRRLAPNERVPPSRTRR